jgi:hypothetical protein
MTTANDDQDQDQDRKGLRIGGKVAGLFHIENAEQAAMLFVPGKRRQIRFGFGTYTLPTNTQLDCSSRAFVKKGREIIRQLSPTAPAAPAASTRDLPVPLLALPRRNP